LLLTPCFGEFTFKGLFQNSLTIDLELLLRLFQAGNPVIKFTEKLFQFCNNGSLFGYRNEREKLIPKYILINIRLSASNTFLNKFWLGV